MEKKGGSSHTYGQYPLICPTAPPGAEAGGSNLITFGKYEGKSFEWLFFKAPWYAEWMKAKGVHRNEHLFSEEQGDEFEELMRRASCLKGICKWCGERPFTRMGLSTHLSGALGAVGFYCDECEYQGGSPTDYYESSMFMPYDAPRCEQRRLTDYIKNRYVGPNERLTQVKMEEFFQNDAQFAHPSPGFFNKVPTLTPAG